MSEFKPKSSLRTIRVIYFGILGMPVAFIIMVLNVVEEEAYFNISLQDSLQLALLILCLLVIPASIIVPKKQLEKIKPGDSLQSRIAIYQTVLMIKSALWAGVANFGIVLFMMMYGNLFPLSIAIIVMLIVATYYPSISNIQKTIGLDPDEIKQLS